MSAPKCRVCSNVESSSIDGWLRAGLGPRAIARRISLSRVQLKRHQERCLGSEDPVVGSEKKGEEA